MDPHNAAVELFKEFISVPRYDQGLPRLRIKADVVAPTPPNISSDQKMDGWKIHFQSEPH